MNAGTLEIQLLANIARLQKDMDDAKAVVGNAMNNISTYVDLAKKAFVGFLGVASVNAFVGMVKGSIEASAGMHDLSIQTGASVAALGAFKSVASTSETTINDIAGAMGKMSKNMAVANEESKGTGEAVKAIGLDFAALQKMSPDQRMLAVAKAMDKFGDGAGKSAVAMTLFGKEGAKMLPFLKDLAEESEAVTGKLTKEKIEAARLQAEMADAFTDNLTLIKKAGEGWKKDVAMGILPALYELSQAWIDVQKGAGGVKGELTKLGKDGTITEWSRMAVTGVTYVMDVFSGLKAVVKSVGAFIGGYAALIMEQWGAVGTVISKIFKGEFSNAIDEVGASLGRQKSIISSFGDSLSDAWSEETLGSKLRARMAEIKGVGAAAKEAKAQVKYNANGEDKEIKKEQDAYAALTSAVKEKIAAAKAEASGMGPLNEAQKLQVALDEQLRTGKLKLSDAHRLEYEANIKSLDGDLRAAEALKESNKRALEGAAAFAKLQKEYHDASEKTIADATAEAQKNEELVATFGMTTTAIEHLQVARLEEQLAQRASTGLTAEEIDGLERLIEAKKRSAAAMDQVEELTKAKAMWEVVESTAHDTFISIFENGKSAFDKLRDTLKNGLIELLYQMTLKQWIINISAQTSMSGGLGGSGGGAGGYLQAGKSLWDGFSGGFSQGLGTIATKFGETVGSTWLQGFGGGATGSFQGAMADGTSLEASTPGAGAGSSLGFAGGIAAIVAVAMAVNDKLYGQGWQVKNGISMNTTGHLLTGATNGYLNPIVGPVQSADSIMQSLGLSSRTASLLSGSSVISRLFGNKNPEVTSQSLSGSFGPGGFSGSTATNWFSKGGWFSSDKSGTEQGAIDPATTSALSDAFAAMKASAADAAKILGVSADSLKDASYSIGFQFSRTGDAAKDAAENEKRLQAALDDVSASLAKGLVPGIMLMSKNGETTGQTLMRMAATIANTDAILHSVGATFGAVGVDSVGAREHLIAMAGGIDALGQGTAFFAQNFLTDAERIAPVASDLEKALSDLGYAGLQTRDQFKAAVEDLLKNGALATSEGADKYAGLLKLAPAFAQVHAAVADTAAALAQVNKGYQDQIDALDREAMSEQKKREIDIKGMDSTTVVLYDLLAARKAEAQTVADARVQAEADAAKAKAILDERKGLQDQFNQLTMTEDQLRAVARDGIATGNRDVFDQITAQIALNKATEAATARTNDFAAASMAAAQQFVASQKAQADAMKAQSDAQREFDVKERQRARQRQIDANMSTVTMAGVAAPSAGLRGAFDSKSLLALFGIDATGLANEAAQRDLLAKLSGKALQDLIDKASALTDIIGGGDGVVKYLHAFGDKLGGLVSIFDITSRYALQMQDVGMTFERIKTTALAVGYDDARKAITDKAAGVSAIGRGSAGDLVDFAARSAALNYQQKSNAPGVAGIFGIDQQMQNVVEGTRLFGQTVRTLDDELALGRLSADEYTKALAYSKDVALAAGAALDGQAAYQKLRVLSLEREAAGAASAQYYLDQLADGVSRLDAASAAASEPLSDLADTIGRLKSAAFVFGTSADAIGSNIADQGIRSVADAIAKAAADATGFLNTAGGKGVADKFARDPAFKGVNFAKIGPMLDSITAFNVKGYEAGFNRLSNALGKGTISVGQYNSLLGLAKDRFLGLSTVTTGATAALVEFRKQLRQQQATATSPAAGLKYAAEQLKNANAGNVQSLVTTYLAAAKNSAHTMEQYMNAIDNGVAQVDSFVAPEDGNSDMYALVENLNASVDRLTVELTAIKQNTDATARNTYDSKKIAMAWDGDGMPDTRTV